MSATQSFAALFNSDVDSLLGTHVIGLCSKEDSAAVLAGFVRVVGKVSDSVTIQVSSQQSPNSATNLSLKLRLLDSMGRENAAEIECVASDGREKIRADRRRQHRLIQQTRSATQDSNSGLPTQLGCEALLASAMRRSARTTSPVSLLRCNLDGLGDIEQEYGSDTARQALDTVLHRSMQQLRTSDSVCLATKDTFLVVAEDLGDEQDAAGVAYRLLSASVEPVLVAGIERNLSMTIGIVVGDGTVSDQQMLEASPDALELAKIDGGGGFSIIDLRVGSASSNSSASSASSVVLSCGGPPIGGP
ncbi:MAG: diguanylate cyclase, partial [Microthrixaceae bacterium]